MGKKTQQRQAEVSPTLNVADAFRALEGLRRSAPIYSDDANGTGNIAPSDVEPPAAEERPSNEDLPGFSRTGSGLTPISSRDVLREMAQGDRETETRLREEIIKVKTGTWGSATAITLAISGIIAGIMIAVLVYFHGDLKSTINSVETRLSGTIQTIQTEVNELRASLNRQRQGSPVGE